MSTDHELKLSSMFGLDDDAAAAAHVLVMNQYRDSKNAESFLMEVVAADLPEPVKRFNIFLAGMFVGANMASGLP
jgi:hypothetical protein